MAIHSPKKKLPMPELITLFELIIAICIIIFIGVCIYEMFFGNND